MKHSQRLSKEYKSINDDPIENIIISPNPINMYDCHFIIYGLVGTPYENGVYHGIIEFPKEYPFKAPGFKMMTPNGRFEINEYICLSYSNYHQDKWDPIWNIRTMMTGFISFMVTNEKTRGCIMSTDDDKKRFAKKSEEFNSKNPQFVSLFSVYLPN